MGSRSNGKGKKIRNKYGKNMTLRLLTMGLLMPLVASAQEFEVVDSIDVETVVIYYADSTQVSDTISTDTIDCDNPPIPQIPLEECDSLMARDITDHYGVVYKGGKCGIYDLLKNENVTRIEYSYLWYAYRKEFEGEYFTYFSWEEPETIGVVGVAEANNQFIGISMPKKQTENNNESDNNE
jgi:hypothetical protein